MLLVAGSIIVVWATLFAAAYLARVVARLSRSRASLVVAGTYLLLGVGVLAWFGLNESGALGIFGMLFPCAAAMGLVLLAD